MSPRSEPAAAGEWSDDVFVRRWVAGDAGGSILDLPRRITAALVAESGLTVACVVDVGSGPGDYLRSMLEAFPEAEGVWVDASEAMLAQARLALGDLGDRVRYELGDIRDAPRLPLDGDVIVSSRAIHHFTPETILEFYRSCAAALPSGGFLFNLDHFAVPGDWRPRYKEVKSKIVPKPGSGTATSHSHDAPPQLLADHLAWLQASGFADPDVPWRLFWTALVVGRVP